MDQCPNDRVCLAPDPSAWRFDKTINLPMVFTIFGALVVVGVFTAKIYSDVEIVKEQYRGQAEQYRALSSALEATNQIHREDFRILMNKQEKRQ